MVICIIALVVFGIMGIFSAKYRQLAKEAFRCVFRMVQLKPCDTGFDQRIKSKLTTKLMKLPPVARFFYKNFKLISWTFTIVFFASMIYSLYGIYNLIAFGNCEPGSGSVCVISSGTNQLAGLVGLLTCYEAYIVYGIIIFVIIALLVVKYLNGKFEKKK